ncbi:papilin isoform X1 [Schistocerca americana]|uniref:papilin isoform X1 n=1 Tax=Schistocerca americana TaxID=7009 RepID=UPI001F4F28E4|nr:papilin isoform X1 [Schistocerca americana]
MPRGERFYYRHKQAVIDGTRCNDEKLDVCVEGQCLPVGCDMLLGSTAVEDKCRECRGDGSGCKTVEDLIDTDDLQVGYNDILLIPAGATNIRVHELKASSNYLAIRNESGHYYLNGNWRIDFPRSLRFAGTIFHYERVPHAFLAPESISALGPTREAVYIVLLYQGTNPGIHYEYSIPKGVSQPTDPDTYTWIPGEFSDCTVTCGGGFQVRNVSCIRRKDGLVVPNDLCDPSLEPRRNESCGTDPCLPEWSVGDWSSCSATCGGGVQTRPVYCERIVSNNLPSIVDEEQCLEVLGLKPLTSQPCNQDVVCPTWHVGPWRPCDRLCGEGRHRRRVRCYRRVDGRIEVLHDSSCSPDKPDEEKPCLLRPCEGVDWILSEWSGCENKCGLTFETREAHCVSEAGVSYPEKFCQPYLLEELKRPCKSPRPCDHEWFASQWSDCSAECGTGIQTRKVFCGAFDGDRVKRVDNENCDLSRKYEEVRNCTGKEECQGQWYHGPWSKCDKECGGGTKVRQVLCLVANETADVNKCDADKFPFKTDSCNNHQCSEDEVITTDDEVSLEEECEEEEEIYFTTDTVLEASSMGKTESPSSVKDIATVTSEVGAVSADGLPSQTFVATIMSDSVVSGLSSVSTVSLSEGATDTKGSPESSFSTAAMADEELMLSDAASTFEDEDTAYTTDAYDETTDDFSSTDESFTDEPHSLPDTSGSDGTSSEAPLSTSVPETTSGEDVMSTETYSSTDSQSLSSSQAPDTTSVGTTASDTDGSTSFGTTVNLYETSVVPDKSTSVDSTTAESITDSGTVTAEITGGETETADDTTEISGLMTTSSGLETDTVTESSSTDTSSSTASDESSSTASDESSSTASDESSSTASYENSSTPTVESTSESSDSSTVSSAISLEGSTTTVSSDAEESTIPQFEGEFDASAFAKADDTIPQQTTEGSSTAYSEVTTDELYSSSSDSSSLIPSSTSESSFSSLTPGSSYPTEVSSVTTSEPEVSQSTGISTSQESAGTEVLTSTEISMTTEVSASTEPSETTEETIAETSTPWETSMATTVSPAERTSVSSETTVSEETASSATQTMSTSVASEETSEVASTTADKVFTGSTGILDYTSTKEAAVTTKKESLWETATTLRELVTTIKSKGKKCRRRKKPRVLKCEETKFGCCADGITKAQGPFSLGCPQLRTCGETKYGCCPDEVSPAKGPHWEGCPPSLCAETLFGCCPDNVSIAEGNDFEGCPDEEPPCDYKTSEFGCCPDGITKALGPNNAGCFECEGSGECTCADTKFGCCPDGVRAATGPNNTGCYDDEFEGSGVTTPWLNATEAELDCTASEHGCCPDGYLPATGPYFEGCGVINSENCTASYFGCCLDQINPALGPDYIGCRMPCESEKYGCCRDGITPAHGPNEEGCCLNSEFGCCPDNVLPAQGPNLEGCGCEYTRYRCCPDNKTAARGPGNEGCGCKYTKHGCCPNNYTPAAGPNYEGCPCHTFQFGCCPDGITIARGLHNQGCGCENTEFGCCSDDKTPAAGPNKEGCGCEASKYGCCPDGVSEAEGEKFEGCEDAPIIASEICTLPKSRGSCRDFTVKWFFDTEYGGCSRFWYGGCEGNENRFKTQEECKNICVEPPGREACYLPKIAGPCEGYYPTWYYDLERKQCGQFIYGGCLGNNNKFQTQEECEALCVLPDTIDACEQPKDEGPCKGNYRRWFFNREDGVCEEFAYGGCKGNRNNFLTEAACHQQCLQPGRSREQDICTLKPVVGGECYNYTERWYYDSYEVRCRSFYYNGCGGNENNFLTLQDCENRCEKRILTPVPAAEFRKESCFLPDEQGPCSESMAKWFYDSRDGVCKQFLYGGCEGNDNRFSSHQECEEKCGDVQDICNLPRVVGPCSGSIPQWYYDRVTDSCYEFDYGGCQGNKNKFDDKQQCEQYCKRYHFTTSAPDVSALLLTTQDDRMNEIESTDICSAPVDPGPCQGSIVSWYYDKRSGRCGSFAYGGCGGNANRFQSEEQCERQCGAFKGQDVCNIPFDPGYCQDALQKWYYDGTSRSCTQFSYTGCGGSGNRFSSQEECESVCLQYQEVPPLGNDTALSRQAICRLPVDSGPCAGGYHKRWYYDDERQTCIPFIYTGCGGNFNRFKNFQSCLSFCSVVLQGGNDDKIEDKPEEKVDCTSAKENCNLLQCPYGIERFVNADSCEICQCHEPCKDHICPDGTRCAVDLYQNTETDDTEFRAVCRPVNKPGECPKLVEENENCIQECQSDADCTDIRKCCFSGCGSSCLNPVYPGQLLTTERPVVQPQPQPPYGVYDEPPSIDLTDSDVQAEEGSYATLKCIAQGRPTPRIVWRKGTSTIDGSSGRYRLLLDGSLQIIGLYRSDAGVYICTADNGIGQPAQKETHLKVTDPHPRPAEIIGEDSTYVVVTLGAPTSLHCYAVGWPRPSVTWWRGERLLPLSSEQYEQRRDYSLFVRSVALRQLGPYTCQAYNGQGKATSWTVTVQAIGPVYSNNPIDRDYFQYLVSAPRRAPERNKTASSQTRPSYPYRPVRPPYRPRPATTQTIPVMTMTTTTTTTTPQPVEEREDENVLVPKQPRVFVVPVQVNVTVDRTVYPVGSEISIACDVDGYPIPQVQWFKDDNPLQVGNRIQVSESHRLLISRAEGTDSGTYRCAASNPYSASSSAVSVVVEGIYIHPNCTDNPFFANCSLIVKGQYCTHKYYAHFCCKSCTLAGQLPSYGPHLERTGTSRIDGRRK